MDFVGFWNPKRPNELTASSTAKDARPVYTLERDEIAALGIYEHVVTMLDARREAAGNGE